MVCLGENNMTWIQSRTTLLLMILLGFLVLGVSLWDIVFEKGWRQQILAGYMILILLILVLRWMGSEEKSTGEIGNSVTEFEKTLKGKLSQFQCPSCRGIFAIKKSKYNNKKPVKMTCPGCGTVGIIPSAPKFIGAEIPEQKSPHVIFKCTNCNERITIWAEGTGLYQDICVFSCPYCGEEQSMNHI